MALLPPELVFIARLNHQRPIAVSGAEWLQALDGGGGPIPKSLGNIRGGNGMERGRLVRLPARGLARRPDMAIEGRACASLDAVSANLSDGRMLRKAER